MCSAGVNRMFATTLRLNQMYRAIVIFLLYSRVIFQAYCLPQTAAFKRILIRTFTVASAKYEENELNIQIISEKNIPKHFSLYSRIL